MLGFDITISRRDGDREIVLATYRERMGAGTGSRFDLVRHLLRAGRLETLTGNGYPSTYLTTGRHITGMLTRERLALSPPSEDDDLRLWDGAIAATGPDDSITITAWDLS